MRYLKTTYKTFTGIKEITEIFEKKTTQWIIYKDGKPAYYVDFFNLNIESNSIMNSLVLCGKRSVEEVLDMINKKNNINLHLPKISCFWIKTKSKSIKLDLKPIPEKWISYTL